MILYSWDAESAICALCAVSVLPRVFLSVSSVEQKILRFAQDDSVDKAQDDSWMLRMTVRRSVLHVIRSATTVMLSGAKHLSHHSAPLSFRPSEASGEICMLVMLGTVVGIYGLRRLQLRRCGELGPKGLSSRLAVAF